MYLALNYEYIRVKPLLNLSREHFILGPCTPKLWRESKSEGCLQILLFSSPEGSEMGLSLLS